MALNELKLNIHEKKTLWFFNSSIGSSKSVNLPKTEHLLIFTGTQQAYAPKSQDKPHFEWVSKTIKCGKKISPNE